MGYLKLTCSKTGRVYDSREPVAQFLDTGLVCDDECKSKDVLSAEPIYKYPNGKDTWIDDTNLADFLGCSVDEISEKLKEWL